MKERRMTRKTTQMRIKRRLDETQGKVKESVGARGQGEGDRRRKVRDTDSEEGR